MERKKDALADCYLSRAKHDVWSFRRNLKSLPPLEKIDQEDAEPEDPLKRTPQQHETSSRGSVLVHIDPSTRGTIFSDKTQPSD